MSVHTKNRPIDPGVSRPGETIELRVIGPRKKRRAAFRALRELGFVEVADSIPWRDAFPQIEDEDLPGTCLRGARQKERLTQVELARKTGIPQRHLSEMEHGKRPIGKKTAALLAEALGVSYKIFL